MAKKPKAFVIIPYSEPYQHLYEQVIKNVLNALNFDCVRADEIQQSSSIIENIERSINTSDLIIAEVSEKNQNVYFELGLAWRLNKEIILLVQKEKKIPTDTRLYNHLVYDKTDLALFESKLRSWITDTDIYFQLHLDAKERRKVLYRGDVLENIFDATFYFKSNTFKVKDKIVHRTKSGPYIGGNNLYETEDAAERWKTLCDDPEYEGHKSSFNFINSIKSEIIASLGDDIIRTSPDFISLGPGAGYKDSVLLRELLRQMRKKKISEGMYYYPYDISLEMLSLAIKQITTYSSIRNNVKVKAINSDFSNIFEFRPVFNYRKEPNIFFLLGNTLGNTSREKEALVRMYDTMRNKDFLILELRLHSGEVEDLGGDETIRKRFIFSPLERIGVQYEPNNLNLIEDTSISQIDQTKTAKWVYSDAKLPNIGIQKDITILIVNYYNKEKLKQAILDINFTIVSEWSNNSTVVFSLQKNL